MNQLSSQQKVFLQKLSAFTSMFRPNVVTGIVGVLLSSLENVTVHVKAGYSYAIAEGVILARVSWRVRERIRDPSQTDAALQALEDLLPIGMEALRGIDCRGPSPFTSMIKDDTGVQLWSSSQPTELDLGPTMPDEWFDRQPASEHID